MDEAACLEELEDALKVLIETNCSGIPVVVEGEKDVAALRSLGLSGEIISLNVGLSIPDFCDKLSERFSEIIVLTDWDRTGGRLAGLLCSQLKGRVICDMSFREVCVRCCMVRVVEGLPSFLQTLRDRVENK